MKILATPDDSHEMMYLVHDKSNIGRPGTKFPALERKLKKPDVSKKPLFRGIDSYNVKQLTGLKVGDTFTTNTYWSASEDKNQAAQFAKGYRTNKVVEFAAPVKGFCLWKYGVADTKSLSEEEYKATDGDFMIETYEEEAEWIIGIGITLKVVAVDAQGFPSKLKQV